MEELRIDPLVSENIVKIAMPATIDTTGQEDVVAHLQAIADAAEEKAGSTLTTPSSVADYMRQSKGPNDWNDRCDAVKVANGGGIS